MKKPKQATKPTNPPYCIQLNNRKRKKSRKENDFCMQSKASGKNKNPQKLPQ